jgi:hypothetical protein
MFGVFYFVVGRYIVLFSRRIQFFALLGCKLVLINKYGSPNQCFYAHTSLQIKANYYEQILEKKGCVLPTGDGLGK